MAKQNTVFNWIAELARLLPEATFHHPSRLLRDGRTRIGVQVGDNFQDFVVAERMAVDHFKEVSTPQSAADHFLEAVDND